MLSGKKTLKNTVVLLLTVVIMLMSSFIGVYMALQSGIEDTKTGGSGDVPLNDEEVDVAKPDDVGNYNVLVLGTDIITNSLTDVMIMVNVNKKDHKVTMSPIPRDTRVFTESKSGGKESHKINSMVGRGGLTLCFEKIKELTGAPVNYYIFLNPAGFKKIIDILGGVDFYVDRDMNYEDPEQGLYIHLKKGQQILDGNKAEQFMRFRRLPLGDLDRVKNQQSFIHAFFEQKLKPQYILKIPEILNTIGKNLKTNFTTNDILNQMDSIKLFSPENIVTKDFPGEQKDIGGASYFIADTEKARDLFKEFFNGEGNINNTAKN